MKLERINMNRAYAVETIKWRYTPPYDFYNNQLTEENIKERLDGSYYVLIHSDMRDTFGYYCTGKSAQVPSGNQYGAYEQSYIDIGLGMNPLYIGKGNGYGFCTEIINYIKDTHHSKPIRLTVASFNKKAVHLYKTLGFRFDQSFSTDTSEFLVMVNDTP